MNRLSTEKRAKILQALLEGCSIRSVSRLLDVSKCTVSRMLVAAGRACEKYHDVRVRDIDGRRNIQCDEIWDFVFAKRKNAALSKPLDRAGDVWLWTALDSDSKLLTAYHVSMCRDARSAIKIMRDLKSRLRMSPNISADKLEAYRIATRKVFGRYARLRQSKADGRTAHVERHNRTIRMTNRRYTRKTDAFSKKLERHIAMVHLWAVWYNFCRIHMTLEVTPAMAAGIDDTLRDLEWIVGLVDADTPKPKKPGPRKGTKYRRRKSKEG